MTIPRATRLLIHPCEPCPSLQLLQLELSQDKAEHLRSTWEELPDQEVLRIETATKVRAEMSEPASGSEVCRFLGGGLR